MSAPTLTEYALRNRKTGKLRFTTTDAVHIGFLYEAFKKSYELVQREVGLWTVSVEGGGQ